MLQTLQAPRQPELLLFPPSSKSLLIQQTALSCATLRSMPPLAAGPSFAGDYHDHTDDETGPQLSKQSQLADWLTRAEEKSGILAAISANAAQEAVILKVRHVLHCLSAHS